MKIWIDADACPKIVKELLLRLSERQNVELTFVANHFIRLPQSDLISFIQVSQGFDMADDEIVRLIEPGDLVVTADIPLVSEAIEKGAQALNPRGQFYTEANIAERLAMRNMMEELRGNGLVSGGPSSYGVKEKENFANQLNKFVTKALNKKRQLGK